MTVTLDAPEVRTYAPQLRLADVDGDEQLRWLEGLAVPYDTWTNVGWYFEKVAKHAPDKSCREAAKGLPLLLWHDNRSFPIGVSDKWRLNDAEGLGVVWRLDDSEDARRAAKQARDGFLTGLSIGFQPMKSTRVYSDEDDWDEAVSRDESMMQVTRTEIRLLEVSLTPTPAFAGAQVQLVRSADRPKQQSRSPITAVHLAEQRAFVEAARAEL